MTPLLECRGLTKRYGSLIALNNVTLTLERGKIIGLLGPNASGKTTRWIPAPMSFFRTVRFWIGLRNCKTKLPRVRS